MTPLPTIPRKGVHTRPARGARDLRDKYVPLAGAIGRQKMETMEYNAGSYANDHPRTALSKLRQDRLHHRHCAERRFRARREAATQGDIAVARGQLGS